MQASHPIPFQASRPRRRLILLGLVQRGPGLRLLTREALPSLVPGPGMPQPDLMQPALLQSSQGLGQLDLQGLARLVIQRALRLQALLGEPQLLGLGLGPLMGRTREPAVDLGAGDALQEVRPLLGIRPQEGGKVPLGQQHGSPELVKVEP